ncbi:hypothetical protein [Nibribacter koreensis]|uniref:Outer membrane protein beta-barrel domain-containing protein n=1 Tax=Nibribacter koreensis TaxID=1084519 RepID=A0ABP8FQV1_9BACT
MKHIHYLTSLCLKTAFVAVLCSVISFSASGQHVYKNSFRSGVAFAYIVEGDNSGALFSNQYSRELTDRLNVAISGEYLSSSRFDQGKKIFTSRKAFVMFDTSVYFDLLENDKFTIKIGAGPAVRRRSELDLAKGALGDNTTPGATPDEQFIHTREKDFGGKIALENDFFSDNRLFFGWRATGYLYNKGTSIFSVGLNMGYAF